MSKSSSNKSSGFNPLPSINPSIGKSITDDYLIIKELYENVLCPICLEHPHDAVLLICSNHDKGCRPYMCNASCTSPCLARYHAMSANQILSCPLCRGQIIAEHVAVEKARWFMDSKVRSCEEENCGFSGNLFELTWHWHQKHSVVPLAVQKREVMRKREWERLERQRELSDVVNHLWAVGESAVSFEALDETIIVGHDTSAAAAGVRGRRRFRP